MSDLIGEIIPKPVKSKLNLSNIFTSYKLINYGSFYCAYFILQPASGLLQNEIV